MRRTFLLAIYASALVVTGAAPCAQEADSAYLSWSASQAEDAAKSMEAKGRVAGTRGFMNTRTDQARNYKLRAFWLTPEVIRGTARVLQLRDGLSAEQTRQLVAEAEAAGDTVVMIELDPHEGSGVIPGDWGAILRPNGAAQEERGSRGTDSPKLRNVPALNGVGRRDYAYDRFWMVFPLTNAAGQPLFSAGDTEAELEVRIRSREGRVRWPVPDFIRRKISARNSGEN